MTIERSGRAIIVESNRTGKGIIEGILSLCGFEVAASALTFSKAISEIEQQTGIRVVLINADNNSKNAPKLVKAVRQSHPSAIIINTGNSSIKGVDYHIRREEISGLQACLQSLI